MRGVRVDESKVWEMREIEFREVKYVRYVREPILKGYVWLFSRIESLEMMNNL